MNPGDLLLALDTATTTAVLAIGDARTGALVVADAWDVGHRHAEELLGHLDALLASQGLARPDVGAFAAIAVGTGPGAFTGMRVGIATAKGLARALEIPLVAVPTGAALRAADGGAGPLYLPAGPADHYRVTADGIAEFRTGALPDPLEEGAVAVDLAGRAPAGALERGARARAALPAALCRLAAARLAARELADPALLVPQYVALPRGLRAAAAPDPETAVEVTWSPARP